MDFFSHGLWSFLLFHKQKWKYWAILFGTLPDIGSWFLFMIYRMVNGAVWGRPTLETIPDWVWQLYGFTHSVIIFLIVFLLVWAVFRQIKWILLPWLIHILIDMPTHSKEFLPTPFLWPLSDWCFPGISWGARWFMILDAALIAVAYSYFFIYKPWKDGTYRKQERIKTLR